MHQEVDCLLAVGGPFDGEGVDADLAEIDAAHGIVLAPFTVEAEVVHVS